MQAKPTPEQAAQFLFQVTAQLEAKKQTHIDIETSINVLLEAQKELTELKQAHETEIARLNSALESAQREAKRETLSKAVAAEEKEIAEMELPANGKHK